LSGGSIFFAKTLQFRYPARFLMLKVLLFGVLFSFLSIYNAASRRKSYKKISTIPYMVTKTNFSLHFYQENQSKQIVRMKIY